VTTIALVHDYLTQRGGAERVVLSLLKAFPGAPLYTSLYAPESTYPEFADVDVRTLWTDRVPGLRADHRRGLLLYPAAFSSLRVDADVTICSSSAFAHGARATGRKVVYCHTPARWLYDEAPTYMSTWPSAVRAGLRAAAPALRRWDRRAAQSADAYLANSTVVAQRIKRHYGLDAEVVPPPVPDITGLSLEPVPGLEPGFVLTVTRLLPYKNVDVVVEAFRSLPDERLVIVGEGPERDRISSRAGPNVSFLGRVSDAQLRWLYSTSAALVSASHEDYGLTPLEAASFGKPAAVLRGGGFLDTVVDGVTGLFFDAATASLVAAAASAVLTRAWDARVIMKHAAGFGEQRFCNAAQAAAHQPALLT
jgi:glycosyltransferase involved in cell wall biosynthesis